MASNRKEIDGTSANERIVGTVTNDDIEAGRGNDTVGGKDGHDEIDGEAGNDRLYGDAGNDEIDGGLGRDKLYGGAGNDRLEGEEGYDTVSGGAGNDVFVLDERQGNADRILDFKAGTDRLEIEDDDFGGGLREGALSADRLVVGSDPFATVAGKGAFLFDTDNSKLFWDVDGAGGQAAVHVATLQGLETLSTADFIIVG